MCDQVPGPTTVAWPSAGPAKSWRPEPGARAAGHGARGAVIAVADCQPLAADGIWRVTLAREPCGRLAGRGQNGPWRLLQLDDLTDEQLAVFEAAVARVPVAA